MRVILASEISTYIFCQRAWWYRLKGIEPENKGELAGGVELHEKHGRTIALSSWLQRLAYALLLLALVAIATWLIQSIL